jgi:putative peptidoglycan lipid II flippase
MMMSLSRALVKGCELSPTDSGTTLLVGLPIALLGQAVGQSAFPRIAAHAARLDWAKLRRTVLGAVGAAVALAVPALLALIFLGRPIIRILFVHGKFDTAAGALTYGVLTVYAIALPAYVGTKVLTRGLIALRDTRTPLLTNSAQVGGRAVLMALLLGRLGVVAIPAGLGVMATLETLLLAMVLLVKLQRRLNAPGG